MARNHQGGVTWLAQGHSPARAWLCVCVTVPAQKEAVSPLPIPLSGPLSQTLELWAWRPVCCGLPVQRIRTTSPSFYTYQLTLPLTPPIPRWQNTSLSLHRSSQDISPPPPPPVFSVSKINFVSSRVTHKPPEVISHSQYIGVIRGHLLLGFCNWGPIQKQPCVPACFM